MTWLDAFRDADEHTIPARLIRERTPPPETHTPTAIDLPKQREGQGPLVSVVIPTYKDSQYLPTALESVREQTYANLEIVLVDSSGVAWIEQVAADADWIRYVRQEPRGVSAARNAGIARASGEYIALLDADDYWHPEKIDRQVAALTSGADCSFTGHYFVKFWNNDQPRVKLYGRELEDPQSADRKTLTQALKPHTSTLVFRSSAVDDRPFNEELNNFEDIVFAVELFSEHPPAHLPEPLSVRRLREGSLSDRTATIDKFEYKIEAYEYLAETHPALESAAGRMKAKMAAEVGWQFLEEGARQQARRYFRRSLQYAPTARTFVLYVATLSPVAGERVSQTIETCIDSVQRLSSARQARKTDQFVTIE